MQISDTTRRVDHRRAYVAAALTAALAVLFLATLADENAIGQAFIGALSLPLFAYRWQRWFGDEDAPYVSSGFINAFKGLSALFGVLGFVVGVGIGDEMSNTWLGLLATAAFVGAWIYYVPSVLIGGALILLTGGSQAARKQAKRTAGNVRAAWEISSAYTPSAPW